MKKFLSGMLAAVFALSCLSCQRPDAEPTKTPTPTEELTPTETPTGTPTQTVTVTENPTPTLSREKARELEYMVEDCRDKAWELGKTCVELYTRESARKEGTILLASSVKGFSDRHSQDGIASVWHYTAFYAMTSRLAYLDEETEETDYFRQISEMTYDGFAWYLGTGDVVTYETTLPMSLYAVNRASAQGKADISGVLAVYDDQMWIIRENLYSYKQSGEMKYLEKAQYLTDCCLAGWDSTERVDGTEYGGIPWGPGYASKHTCSNAPLIAPLVELYEILDAQGNENACEYLEWAEKIYSFCYKNLKNEDSTYGDMFGTTRTAVVENGVTHYRTTGQGSKDSTVYPYNTGTMLSGAAALYRATGNRDYYRQGVSMANAAYRVFCTHNEAEDTYLWPTKNATLWFNQILLQGYIDFSVYYDKCEDYILTYQKSLDYAYDNYQKDGLFPRNFIKGWDTENGYDQNKDVMDSATVAEMYALLADWANRVLTENGY